MKISKGTHRTIYVKEIQSEGGGEDQHQRRWGESKEVKRFLFLKHADVMKDEELSLCAKYNKLWCVGVSF